MAFRCKQFIVEDDFSTMRIGTDAMLLGAWAQPGNAKRILEIGTGCGLISLMLAQRSNAKIDAIDIDESSINQARTNFQNSLWTKNLHAYAVALQDFLLGEKVKYDIIITNPPFFIDSLLSADSRKNRARHNTDISRQELLSGIQRLLESDGSFYVILPVKESDTFTLLAREKGLYVRGQMNVRPISGKPINRVLSCFGFQSCDFLIEELCIRNEDHSFTEDYMVLTEPYYFSLR